MNSKVHISIVEVRKGDRFFSPMIQIEGLDPTGQTNRTAFTEYDEEGRLEVFFRSDHEEWLKEQVMSSYHRVLRK